MNRFDTSGCGANDARSGDYGPAGMIRADMILAGMILADTIPADNDSRRRHLR